MNTLTKTVWNAIALVALVVGGGVATMGCEIKDEPEVSDFKLSASEAKQGETVTGTAMVEDMNSDLSGGKMEVTLKAEDGTTDVRNLPIELGGDAGKAAVSLSLEIAQTAPPGNATIELVVIDKEGHRSNTVLGKLLIKDKNE